MEVWRNWNGIGGTGLESDKNEGPVSPGSTHTDTNCHFSLNLPWGPKLTQKLLTFLSRSNKHSPNFHFATEYFKCWPLLSSCSMDSSCNGYRYQIESRICDIMHYSAANNNSTVCRYALTPGRNLHLYSWYICMLND